MTSRILRAFPPVRERNRNILLRVGKIPTLLGCCFFSATAALAAAANPTGSTGSVMRMKISADAVEFLTSDGALAGRYNYTDAFKPYVHPLQSPKGHSVSLVSPHDHQHHKGLMYALRIPELNFWEERSTLPGEAVGRQRHVAFSDLRESGNEVGFTETLSWEPAAGGPAVFEETRRISCRRDGAGFRWTWDTSLNVRRATRLVQSQWSHKKPDGGKINYHGLGLRLRREFGGGTRNNGLQLDDAPIRWNKGSARFDFTTAMGATPGRVTFIGSIDGIWPTPQVAVTLAQGQRNALFVMEEPFALFALGPSNLAERPLAAGETLREHYAVTIADVDLKPRTAP